MTHSKITLNVHHDADGIGAAVLLAKGLGLEHSEVTVHFPEGFGENHGEDYMVDMKPADPDFEGIVYDHHPGHPKKKNRKYKLIWDNVPAGVVVYNKHKDTIPIEDRWKVVVSAMGDVSPESIPLSVFKENPELLFEQVWVTNNNWGEDKPPLQLRKLEQLSSRINAVSRMGELKLAFDILFKATSVDSLLNNKICLQHVKKQNTVVNSIYKKWKDNELPKPVIIKGMFLFAIIDTPMPFQGYCSTSLSNKLGMTTVVLNSSTGNISIRGKFTNIVKEGIAKSGVTAGGHSVASGGSLPDGMDYAAFQNILEGIL